MDTKLMTETARAMVAPGKGLLAADESAGTCKKRFDSVNVECNEENRRVYRELLFTTPNLSEYVSGVILFDETLRQKTKDGVNFAEYLKKNAILPGIKVAAAGSARQPSPDRRTGRSRQRPRCPVAARRFSNAPTKPPLPCANRTRSLDRKSTRLNSSHGGISRMPSSA